MSVNTSYTIQMASKISGVGVHTIRAWEKRYKALEPNRDSSGHRTYTKIDVEKLMLLSELCLLGYTISKVAKLSIPELKLLLKDLGKSEESIDFPELNLVKEKPLVDASLSTNLLLFALKNYKIDVINQEIGKIKSSISARDMAMYLLLPMVQMMRDLSARGEYTRTQEETVSSLLRFHAGHTLFRTNDRKEHSHINVVVVSMDNDSLDLGALIAGLLCNHYGFNYTFLGHNLSVEALCDSIGFLNSNLVILSTANSSMGLPYIQPFVEKLFQKAATNVEVLLNGKADLSMDKIPAKRFNNIKSIEALDEFFSKKRN